MSAQAASANGKVSLTKLSSKDGSPLPGATFKLSGTSQDGESITLELTTDENGELVFEVPAGTYDVSETKAPDGYQASTETKTAKVVASEGATTVEISMDGTYTETWMEDPGMPGPGGCTCTPEANCGCYDEAGVQHMDRCTCGTGGSTGTGGGYYDITKSYFWRVESATDANGKDVSSEVTALFNDKEPGSFLTTGSQTLSVTYKGETKTETVIVPDLNTNQQSWEDTYTFSFGGSEGSNPSLVFENDPIPEPSINPPTQPTPTDKTAPQPTPTD